MVNPGKEAAAAGGRAKARSQNNAFTVLERPKPALTERTSAGTGGVVVKFPKNWHELNGHPKKLVEPGPSHKKRDWPDA